MEKKVARPVATFFSPKLEGHGMARVSQDVGFGPRRVFSGATAMNDDLQLIRRYARQNDEAAFGELVQRHLNLVWGTARRITGDADLARDVAQSVFIDLARKASELPENAVLAGWLHRAACMAAWKVVRTNVRRRHREQQSITIMNDSDPETEAARDLQSEVDEALETLSADDRAMVIQRFFERKSFAAIGLAIGISEDTAQKRMSRTLNRLRDRFQNRGIAIGEGAIAATLTKAGTQAAPLGLAEIITRSALVAAAKATVPAGVVTGAKLGWALGAVAAVATGLALTEMAARRTLSKENASLHAKLDEAMATIALPKSPPKADEHPSVEILRLRGEVAALKRDLTARSSLPASSMEPKSSAANSQEPTPQAAGSEKQAMEEFDRRVQFMKSLGLVAKIYSDHHQSQFPTSFDQIAVALSEISDSKQPLDQLEFFPHQRAIDATEPKMILLREKSAYRMPDGNWVRIYGMADGSVETRWSRTGDFGDFEAEGTGTDANAPKSP